ncbi:hypothetical protein I4U23_016817 [Adineta vaga]|nr:hypothetical protein I4U23_016817 [Adineta vaga]
MSSTTTNTVVPCPLQSLTSAMLTDSRENGSHVRTFYIIIVTLVILSGVINNLLSLQTFVRKKIRLTPIGVYLILYTITSLLVLTLLENDSPSSRETRMEIAAWIAVCQLNCRIFGGFVRDWIVGGYSVKPIENNELFPWITYTYRSNDFPKVEEIPHVIKEFVPNDIDCYLTDNNFDINRFSDELRKYGIKCGNLIRTQNGLLLLLDEGHSPFTMDLVTPDRVLEHRKYRTIDIDVNNLYIEKDYLYGLGIRWSPNRNLWSKLNDLERLVKNIKNKQFMVLRSYDTEDRIEKMIKRGWIQLKSK